MKNLNLFDVFPVRVFAEEKMRRFNAFLFVLIVVMLLVSCAENPGTTTMKLVLSTQVEEGSRTLLPTDSTLIDVTKYTVSGVGPNGKTFTKNSCINSVEITGLTIGEWTVTAKGLNREGTELVSGTSTFTLTSTPTPQTIVLDTLIGTGSFSFVLDWSLCDVAEPGMEVYLTGPEMDSDEVPLVATLNSSTKTATVTESLAAGSYKIRVILKDGNEQVAGLVEAIRISNGMRTSGNHTFLFNELGPTTLTYFNDATGTPLKGTLSASGNPESFLNGLQYTYLFTFSEPATIDTEGLSMEWYYDGNLTRTVDLLDATGSSLSMMAEYGVHRIDAVVYNKRLGSTGSASYTFTVVPNGVRGEMALLNETASGAVSTIDTDSIITPLPGEMFLVTSPNSAKIYICSISSRALQVVKEYDVTNFPWLSNVKHVFSSADMNYIVETDNKGGTENFGCLYYNAASKTLESVDGIRYEGIHPSVGVPFTNLTSAAFNAAKGFIYVSDSGASGFCYLFRVNGGTLSFGGAERKKSNAYYNVADMDCSPDGRFLIYSAISSTKFVAGTLGDTGGIISAEESEAASSVVSKVRFVNSQTVIATNSYEFASFKAVNGGAFTKYKTVGIAVKDIAADAGNYFYVADNSKRLVSFSVSGFEVAQLGSTTLSNAICSICLSGKYLVALTTAGTVALFQVIE